MYTKTKINNLTKNNKILYEKDNWKLTAIYDYEGLIGEAIFCNHFTRTCLRRKEDFFLKINSEKNKKILLPVYILKNEKLKYYRQIERQYPHGIKIYNQLNVPTWIRKKDIPNDIKTILSFVKLSKDDIVFLNEEKFFLEKFLKKENNVEIYKIKNIYKGTALKFKNDNDYFILSEYVLINNINKNKNLLLILLTKLKHYKYKKRPINKIIYEIFKNKQVVFL